LAFPPQGAPSRSTALARLLQPGQLAGNAINADDLENFWKYATRALPPTPATGAASAATMATTSRGRHGRDPAPNCGTSEAPMRNQMQVGKVHARIEAAARVEQFLYRQADLLDSKRLAGWIDLSPRTGVLDARRPVAQALGRRAVDLRRGPQPDERAHEAGCCIPTPVAAAAVGTNHVVSNVVIKKSSQKANRGALGAFHMMSCAATTCATSPAPTPTT